MLGITGQKKCSAVPLLAQTSLQHILGLAPLRVRRPDGIREYQEGTKARNVLNSIEY